MKQTRSLCVRGGRRGTNCKRGFQKMTRACCENHFRARKKTTKTKEQDRAHKQFGVHCGFPLTRPQAGKAHPKSQLMSLEMAYPHPSASGTDPAAEILHRRTGSRSTAVITASRLNGRNRYEGCTILSWFMNSQPRFIDLL